MDTVKIFIENWPKTDVVYQIVPIVIAVCALLISLYTAYLSRRSFEMAGRPYLSANNYVILTTDNVLLPDPLRIKFELVNSPSKIIKQELKVTLEGEVLHEYQSKDVVQFPISNGEWTYNIGEDEFKKIKQKYDESKLKRVIFFEYQALNGGRKYTYALEQDFIPAQNQWRSVSTTAT